MATDASSPSAFVLAFLFNGSGDRIVLIRKSRPVWQAGRVNALGGKLMPEEDPRAASHREVLEEAGVAVPRDEWEEFLVWEDPPWRMHATRAFSALAATAYTAEDQEILFVDSAALPDEVIENLRWLVPLARDRAVPVPVRVLGTLLR